jgi:hypothetical protein
MMKIRTSERPIILFFKAIFHYWWALMSCAAFTFFGIYVAASKKGNDWVLWGSVTLALALFVFAAYKAWESEHAAARQTHTPVAAAPIVEAREQPNLVMLRPEVRLLEIAGTKVTCLCVPFRNDVASFRDEASGTVAHLDYQGSDPLVIHNGFWEGSDFNSLTIDRGETNHLVVAIVSVNRDECFAMGDNRDRAERQGDPHYFDFRPLAAGNWSVGIELSAENFTRRFPPIQFSFTKEGGLQVPSDSI